MRRFGRPFWSITWDDLDDVPSQEVMACHELAAQYLAKWSNLPANQGLGLPDASSAVRGGLRQLRAYLENPSATGWQSVASFTAFWLLQQTVTKRSVPGAELEEALSRWRQGDDYAMAGLAAEVAYSLSLFTDDELFQAGVPRPLVPAVKDVRSDEQLESLSEYLPRDCREVLFGLAAGMSIDEALAETLGLEDTLPSPDGPGDFTVIEEAPNFDLVLVEGEEQLREILQASLEEWRIFLHPYQRKLVDWRTKFPIAIRGAAGTGKTVALLHRAARLAQEHEDPKRRILLTTFTTNLAPTLEHHLRLLAPDHADVVDVTNLHKLARSICETNGWTGRLAGNKDMNAVWARVWEDPDLGEPPMSQEELRQELDLVIEANGIDVLDTYLTTVRSGRPRISRRQRRAAWPFFRAFQRELKRRNLLTFEGAIHQARLAAEQGRFDRYVHVLVDEIQDFSLEAMRLVAALAPLGGEDAPDPLCVAGDGHQRIYRTKVPLSRAGIHVRGRRSRRLKINSTARRSRIVFMLRRCW